ncbi:uncharacterized protein LOC126820620 [Patella vulgata]|uniref:uncharacterized protein LOC126820620 n=1 Tax=Patella vulgata TaxID=6465 RepID=UPI0024A9CFF2|nr:uncharacterized protein LOC126820620 [Patella vulgata]
MSNDFRMYKEEYPSVPRPPYDHDASTVAFIVFSVLITIFNIILITVFLFSPVLRRSIKHVLIVVHSASAFILGILVLPVLTDYAILSRNCDMFVTFNGLYFVYTAISAWMIFIICLDNVLYKWRVCIKRRVYVGVGLSIAVWIGSAVVIMTTTSTTPRRPEPTTYERTNCFFFLKPEYEEVVGILTYLPYLLVFLMIFVITFSCIRFHYSHRETDFHKHEIQDKFFPLDIALVAIFSILLDVSHFVGLLEPGDEPWSDQGWSKIYMVATLCIASIKPVIIPMFWLTNRFTRKMVTIVVCCKKAPEPNRNTQSPTDEIMVDMNNGYRNAWVEG